MTLPAETQQWRKKLAEFCERFRRDASFTELAADDQHNRSLDPLVDEQRRVTGGVLLQFLDFIQGDTAFDNFPALEKNPIDDRVFVFATDRPGGAAAHDLVEVDSDHVLVVFKEEWRQWLESPATNSDESYDHHFLFWSVWHQQADVDRRIVEETEDIQGEAWIHEEGFAVADRAGRGARHLWSWHDDELELVEEAITTWVSRPNASGPNPTDEFPGEREAADDE